MTGEGRFVKKRCATPIGAPLATLELEIILGELTRRLPSLQMVPGQTWEFPADTSFRGPARLLVAWQRA